MGDERFVIMSIFLLKSDRPQAFTGKRCGLGVLEGRKMGEKALTRNRQGFIPRRERMVLRK